MLICQLLMSPLILLLSPTVHMSLCLGSHHQHAGGPVTGYVIYYQSEGRYNSSVYVSGGETESHSLDCLERRLTHYISIVALSDHLPLKVDMSHHQ